MSLRSKLTVTFLAIALAPLCFVTSLTFHNYENSLEAARLAQMRDTAAFKADKIENYVTNTNVLNIVT